MNYLTKRKNLVTWKWLRQNSDLDFWVGWKGWLLFTPGGSSSQRERSKSNRCSCRDCECGERWYVCFPDIFYFILLFSFNCIVLFYLFYLSGLEITRKSYTYLQVPCELKWETNKWNMASSWKDSEKSIFFEVSLISPRRYSEKKLRESVDEHTFWEPEDGSGRESQIQLWIAQNGSLYPSWNYCVFLRLGGVIDDNMGRLGKNVWPEDIRVLWILSSSLLR